MAGAVFEPADSEEQHSPLFRLPVNRSELGGRNMLLADESLQTPITSSPVATA
jgi:hypothetical protein